MVLMAGSPRRDERSIALSWSPDVPGLEASVVSPAFRCMLRSSKAGKVVEQWNLSRDCVTDTCSC